MKEVQKSGNIIPEALIWKGPPTQERIREILDTYELRADGWIWEKHPNGDRKFVRHANWK